MRRPRILIVDDDDAILEALIMALEDDFELLTARNGLDGLTVIDRERVDVVLLDLMMPVLDGEGYLREHMTRHAQVPVVAMSAGKELSAVARAFGVAVTLPKPFRLDALKRALDDLTGRGTPPASTPPTSPPTSSDAGSAGDPSDQGASPASASCAPTTRASCSSSQRFIGSPPP